MLLRRTLLSLVAPLIAPIVYAQTPPPVDQPAATAVPAFEVISVKQDKAALGRFSSTTPDGYTAKGTTLMYLIMEAYDIKPNYRVIGAPNWWDDTRFNFKPRSPTPILLLCRNLITASGHQ